MQIPPSPRLAAPPSTSPPVEEMVWIPGGTFHMGSNDFYPEEGPVHQVSVHGFWMDAHPVTNERFARFVDATGYLTVAERPLDPALYPGADPALLLPGGLVFRRPAQRVNLADFRQWWAYVPGASWRHPLGPESSLEGLELHPVVQVAYEDAATYARWAGKALPTEAEWEFAARGGLDGAIFAWGNDSAPGGRLLANTWQGEFPWQNLCLDGYERTSPVGAFPPNGYGAYDVTGNVWEWTCDEFQARHQAHPGTEKRTCCAPAVPSDEIPRKVIKGGSHLCAPNYCLRYRPAARSPQAIDTSSCHIGFRCIVRVDGS